MRVVFDVSVLIRVSLGSEFAAGLLRRTLEMNGQILVHEILLAELAETAAKPRLARVLHASVHDGLMVFLQENGERVEILPPFPNCRDPDDGYLLGMARDGHADFLVTGDEDMLSLARLGECRIVSPEMFAGILRDREHQSYPEGEL